MGFFRNIGATLAKAVNRTVGVRGAEPRKGNFQWMSGLPSKKVLKPVVINALTIKQLANTDPITWSIKATRKAQITQTKWDIVRDTEKIEIELDKWHMTIVNNLNPWGFEEVFNPLLINKDLYAKCSKDLKAILEDQTQDLKTKKEQLKWYFASVKRKVQQDAEEHANIVKKIFEKPNNSESPTFRQFLELLVDDILTYDAGVIVKNYNPLGELAELYLLPGQDIKLYRNPDRTVPEAPDYAFVWEDQGTLRAEFTKDEVVYIMANPQQNGYGMSPIEVSAYIITASLFADEYNIDFFRHSNVPPAIFDLGKNITPEQRKNFEVLWDNEVSGRGLHRMMFISGGEDPKYIPLAAQTAKDMQMMEYLKWTLSIKCACFQISPQDISFIQDFHRTTAQVQKELTKERGIRNLLSLLETYFNGEIVKKCFPFQDVKFQWLGLDINDESTQATIDNLDINNGVISRNDRRKRLGLPPVDGGDTILVNATPGAVRIEDLRPPEESQEEEEQPFAEPGQEDAQMEGEDAPEEGGFVTKQPKPSPFATQNGLAGEDSKTTTETAQDTKEQAKNSVFKSIHKQRLEKAVKALKKQGLGDKVIRITLENGEKK